MLAVLCFRQPTTENFVLTWRFGVDPAKVKRMNWNWVSHSWSWERRNQGQCSAAPLENASIKPRKAKSMYKLKGREEGEKKCRYNSLGQDF